MTTQWTCYNCDKVCIDKAARPLGSDVAAWCSDCAEMLNEKSGQALGSSVEVKSLLDKNGMCIVNIATARRVNPTISNNPKIKVEVGQVWHNPLWINKGTITKIENGYAAIKDNSQWGKLTPEGYPSATWDKGWKLTFSPEKPKMKVGQVWKLQAAPSTTYTIAEIKNGRCSVIKKEKDKADTFHDDFGSEDIPTWSKDWYLYQNVDPKTTKPEVGQTWTSSCGTNRKITRIEGKNVFCDNAPYAFGYLTPEGHPDRWVGWNLSKIELTIPPPQPDPSTTSMKVGQVWRVKGDANTDYLVSEIVDNFVSVIESNFSRGERLLEKFGMIDPQGQHKWGANWELHQDVNYEKVKVEVGQSWQSSGGSIRTITNIKGKHAAVPHVPDWGLLTSEGYPDGWANKGAWKLVKIDLPRLKMKVGQIWTCGPNSTNYYKITAIKNCDVYVSCNGQTPAFLGKITEDGHPTDAWGSIGKNGWHLLHEEPTKPKVGQTWKWISNDLSQDLKGKTFTVEKIENGFCHTTAHSRGIRINDDGIVDPEIYKHWELVEDIKEESKGMNSNDDLLLKKLETIHNGCASDHGYGYQFFNEMSGLGYFQHGSLPAHRTVSVRLTVQGRAKMEELQKLRDNPPTMATPKVGQTWKVSNLTYRITQIPADFHDSKSNCIVMELQSSEGAWIKGHSWIWTGGRFTDGMGAEWTLKSSPPVVEADVKATSTPDTQPARVPLRQMLKGDVANASYRVAAYQLTKGTKKAILSLMEKQGHGADRISAIASVLDTEFGSSLVGMLLGMGLTYMPPLTTNGRAQRLATEFRVGSMAMAGNAAADIVMEHFVPVITGALSSLPKENVRVADAKSIKNEDQFELSSHEDSKKEAQTSINE